jgi:hypothetical protein
LDVTPGNQSLQLAWSAPASYGGSAVTGYVVYVDGDEDQVLGPAARSATVTGLTNGVEHEVQVAAVNVAGEGARATSTGTPAALPSAPTGLTATPGDGQVALEWSAPVDDGGSPILEYRVYRDGGETPVHTTPDGTTTSWTDSGVTNGQTYAYVVRAVNETGVGLLSGSVDATPTAPPPAGPTFVDVGPSHPFYADVEWMAAEGISTGYQPGPTYRPADPVSRAAMSAFMYRLAGEPTFAPPAIRTFGDVLASHPFYEEIEWMASEGITTGTPALPKPLYKPADPVSRGAMSAFMHRLADGPGVGI